MRELIGMQHLFVQPIVGYALGCACASASTGSTKLSAVSVFASVAGRNLMLLPSVQNSAETRTGSLRQNGGYSLVADASVGYGL